MGSAKSHVIARSAHSPLSFRQRETCTQASLSRIPHFFWDCLVERDGFEPAVPLVSGENAGFLPISVLCPALNGAAEPDRRTTGF